MLNHKKREAKTYKVQVKKTASWLQNTQVPMAVLDDPLIKDVEKM